MASKTSTPDDAVAPTRYAVYDNSLQRFVSGVVDTRKEADELATLSPSSHDIEVREV